MTRRQSEFTNSEVGDDRVNDDRVNNVRAAPSPQPLDIKTQLKQEKLKNSKSDRNLRIAYAVIAVCFAIASIIFWMRFIQFYYQPEKHSDTFFATLTTACTINILAAFLSIIKGLFPSKK